VRPRSSAIVDGRGGFGAPSRWARRLPASAKGADEKARKGLIRRTTAIRSQADGDR